MAKESDNPDGKRGKKEILITGASGFIGHFLVGQALQRGYRVSVTVRKSSNLSELSNKDVQIILTDLSDSETINRTISRCPVFDFVIHNAGVTKALRKAEFTEVNYGNTRRLIEAFREQNKVPGKFLFMSSIAAYGPGDPYSSLPVNYRSIPAPVTTYGMSKLTADRYIREESGIPHIILHPTAVYGPGDREFLRTIRLIGKGIDFRIGFRPQHLTFIYVKDLARLAFDALESEISNRSYFVADGHLYDHLAFGRVTGRCLKSKPVHIDIPVWLAWLVGASAEMASRISKTPNILSREKISELSARNWNCDTLPLYDDFRFIAAYDLEKGMRETIEWYRKKGWLK